SVTQTLAGCHFDLSPAPGPAGRKNAAHPTWTVATAPAAACPPPSPAALAACDRGPGTRMPGPCFNAAGRRLLHVPPVLLVQQPGKEGEHGQEQDDPHAHPFALERRRLAGVLK